MNSYRRKWNWISAGILLLSAVWIGLTAAFAPATTGGATPFPRVGFAAPDFELAGMDGSAVKLSDFRGKVVFLNFWASWCPPCRAEMPAIQKLSSVYPPEQVAILSVNATNQDNLEDVRTFIDNYGLTFPVLLDIDGSVNRNYQIQALPSSFFIDAEGEIRKVVIGGPLTEAMMRAEIAQLVEELP
ncbi:MAG: redoxin domain-containing protein [Bellilinea sp.]